MGDTQKSQTISTESQGIATQVANDSTRCSQERAGDKPPVLVGESSLVRIRMLAEADPSMVFTSLAHRIDLSLLRKSFRQLRKNESTGVDKITAKQYAENLDENLYNLYQRLRRGQYVATPVKRVWVDKAMKAAGYEMVRYADDFVILCKSQPEAEAALARVTELVQQKGLTLK
jgi:retron-type reverse transcriptase